MVRPHWILLTTLAAALALGAVTQMSASDVEMTRGVQVTPGFRKAPFSLPAGEVLRLLPSASSVVDCPPGAFPDEPPRRLIEGPPTMVIPAIPVVQRQMERRGSEVSPPAQHPCIDFVSSGAVSRSTRTGSRRLHLQRGGDSDRLGDPDRE